MVGTHLHVSLQRDACTTILVQFHPGFEDRLNPDRSLHGLKERVLDVLFDFPTDLGK